MERSKVFACLTCLRRAANAPKKGVGPLKMFFEEPAPSGEEATGAGTTTAHTTGATRKIRFRRIAQREGPLGTKCQTFRRRTALMEEQSDNECLLSKYLCKSYSCQYDGSGKRYSGTNSGVRLGKISVSSEPACHEGTVSLCHEQTENSRMQLGVNFAGTHGS